MSLSDLLTNYPKPWANLYVNSIEVTNPIPVETFDLTFIVAAAGGGFPQTLNAAQFVVPGCTIERLSDALILFTIPQFQPVQTRDGILIADLTNSPLAGTSFRGSEVGYLRRPASVTLANQVTTIGAAYVQPQTARFTIIGLTTASLVNDTQITVEPLTIWLRPNL